MVLVTGPTDQEDDDVVFALSKVNNIDVTS